ncbi:MAG: DUF1361 domain-containing protein [Chthoniobacter sp.]
MSFPPRTIPAHRVRHTLYTLLFGSAVCTGMLLVRFARSGNLLFGGLFINLLLAWIPMLLALFIWRLSSGGNRVWFWVTLVLWILFYPNTFYITTDFVHLKYSGHAGDVRWFDLLMTMSFAAGGMFLGCLSLYLLHLFVRARFGWRLGWLFAGTALALGSFGIYLGRMLRWNSWDVVARPLKLAGDAINLVELHNAKEAIAFSVTFFFFSLAVYSFVVSMARLHESEEPPPPASGVQSGN